MKQDMHVFIERDEDGWLIGSVPSLPGCHTQARTLDELMQRMQEAIEAYLGELGEDVLIGDFIGVQKISVNM